jgi:heme-degrading monooxygenase HmoA
MIARIWHGIVPASKSAEYLELMQKVAIRDYTTTPGNRGAWCLHRSEGDVTHFLNLTFWDDFDAIKRFAGEDHDRARYYDFDPEYLIEMEPHVQHYEIG